MGKEKWYFKNHTWSLWRPMLNAWNSLDIAFVCTQNGDQGPLWKTKMLCIPIMNLYSRYSRPCPKWPQMHFKYFFGIFRSFDELLWEWNNFSGHVITGQCGIYEIRLFYGPTVVVWSVLSLQPISIVPSLLCSISMSSLYYSSSLTTVQNCQARITDQR